MTSKTVAAAVVGGTTSEITGGKFANGAVTAAMVHLFKAEELLNMDDPLNVVGVYTSQGATIAMIEGGTISEYGGWILEEDGRIFMSDMVQGDFRSISAEKLYSIDIGNAKRVGWFHSHPRNQSFSGLLDGTYDAGLTKFSGVPAFVGMPSISLEEGMTRLTTTVDRLDYSPASGFTVTRGSPVEMYAAPTGANEAFDTYSQRRADAYRLNRP